MKAIVNLFLKPSLLGAALLLLLTTTAHSQDDVMRVYSKDGAVYAINTAQVDSVTFAFDCEANCSGLECMNMPRPDDSYNYQSSTETEEKIGIAKGLFDIYQIPTEILENMSTQAVIQAIWEYPPIILVLQRSYCYQINFEYCFLENNAYNELLKRVNVGAALLERLRLVNPLGAMFTHRSFEVLMSQEVFLSQLADKEKCELIETTLIKNELRQSCDIKSDHIVAWLLIGKILASANYSPFMEETKRNTDLKNFLYIKNYDYRPSISNSYFVAIIEIINNYAGRYIKEIKN